MIENILENFASHEKWNFGVLYFLLLTLVLYFVFFTGSPTHKKYKSVLFVIGLLVYFLALGSPLNLLGRIQFRFHIVQMVMIIFTSAPLLVWGMKDAVVHRVSSFQALRSLLGRLTNPVWTLIVFHVLFLVYHVPSVFDTVRINEYVHSFYLLAMFLSALLFWFGMFPSNEVQHQVTNKNRRRLYVSFIVLFIPLTGILLFSTHSLYSIYTDNELILSSLGLCLPLEQLDVPIIEEDMLEALSPFPPKREQLVGGMILLVSQVIAVIFLPFLRKS
ncbi:hypothetical protein FZW96_14545 [Bacillus sp. BGMRC 2118]|nr:hypothetical protein FZW96_14545 [Bacillus sp. BGMRC 2118]